MEPLPYPHIIGNERGSIKYNKINSKKKFCSLNIFEKFIHKKI